MKKEKKEKKVKKDRVKLGKKEKIFNIVSVVILGGLAIYFGSRAVYYALEEHKARQNYDKSLAQAIINVNPLAQSGDGLYKDPDGYFFKGNIENNYVSFNNIEFRIMGMTNNNELILVSEDNVSSFMWGNDLNYEDGNINNWLDKTDKEHSGVFYNLLPIDGKYLLDQNYTVSQLDGNELTDTDESGSGLVTLLSAEDYIKAGGDNSYINNETYYWLMGVDEDGNNLYVDEDGKIDADTTYGSYGVRAVITLEKDVILLRGKGEEDNPYIIQVEGEPSYINTYVKLGENTFKVIDETDGTLKVASLEALSETKSFSNSNTKYNPGDKNNIGYYLNNDYYNNLVYKDKLVDCTFNTGLVNDDSNNDFTKIYGEVNTYKVGMLNIFDYTNTSAEDYFYLTYNGHVSDVAYVNSGLGYLQKVQVTESKNIVPVVCIDKSSITDGVGAEYSPYVVE